MTRVQKEFSSGFNEFAQYLKSFDSGDSSNVIFKDNGAELLFFDERRVELVSLTGDGRHSINSDIFTKFRKNSFIKDTACIYSPVIIKGSTKGLLKVDKSNIGEDELRELERISSEFISKIKEGFFDEGFKYQFLVNEGLITGEVLREVVLKSENPEEILLENLKIDKEVLLSALSSFYALPSIDPSNYFTDTGFAASLRIGFMRKKIFVPFGEDEKEIHIAISDPFDSELISMIGLSAPSKVLRYFVSLKSDIDECLDIIEQKDDSSIEYLIKQLDSNLEKDDSDLEINEENSVIIKLVNKIIIEANDKNASDIHIEPERSRGMTDVRIRIDGILEEFRKIPGYLSNAVISRIKIMADMDISERRRPQDGRVLFKNSGRSLELRIATNVTNLGLEDVVIRILPPGGVIPIDKIGFSMENLAHFKNAVKKPHGLILVCGPTGSGKTTTLHSALNYINKPNIKILTAEDPVEITQKGLRQVQAKPSIGLNFVTILKSFLRLDPDVIMIGEMRDEETIKTAIEASLTGHLVFSTLHTNSAAESIARLNERQIDPFNFSDSLICILSQRLVRVLCPVCKKEYEPDDNQRAVLREKRGTGLRIFKPKGCDACSYSGFSGRMAVHELLLADEGIKSLIRQRATVDRVFEYAVNNGMATLMDDALLKVKDGLLDINEVLRVC